METTEKIIFSNVFGTVTDKRIILNFKNGSEDLPIGQITSVGFQHIRNNFMTFFSFSCAMLGLLGLYMLFTIYHGLGGGETLIILIIVIFAILSGIANWIGHHTIIISSGGMNRKPIKVEMSKTREGKEFVNAIKRMIIK
jgi:hypothetical protein